MLGGVQHLESLAQKAADVDQTDAVFFSGQPEDRKKLATEWYDGEGPHEFGVTSKAIREQVDATLDVMRERDPQSYVNTADRISRQGIQDIGLPSLLRSTSGKSLESGQGLEECRQELSCIRPEIPNRQRLRAQLVIPMPIRLPNARKHKTSGNRLGASSDSKKPLNRPTRKLERRSCRRLTRLLAI